jgi:hypothetical protein
LEATSRTRDRNSGGRTFEKDCISLQTHTSLPVEDDEDGRSKAQDFVSASLQKYEGKRVDVRGAGGIARDALKPGSSLILSEQS